MKRLKKYTSDTTYMSPNGELYTPERVAKEWPAAMHFTFVVETDERDEIMFAMDNLSGLRGVYNINPALDETEAIAAIEALINAPPPEPEPTNEERIAAALEFQNILGMMEAQKNDI